MAFCSACLMLALLAPGGTAADAGLDMSAMVQVVADVTVGDALHAQYDFDSDSEFDAAATEELVFKGVLGTPSELTGSQDFGGKDALTRASKALSKAWIDDARQLLSETANLALTQQETFLADLEPHSDGTEAFEEISEYVKTGKMDWQDLNWIQKMSESHAAMTEKMMEKNIEWQKLASGTSLLQMRETFVTAPQLNFYMVRRGLDRALGIRKPAGDAAVYTNMNTNMTKTLGEAWKKIATNSLTEAARKQVKNLNKSLKNSPVKHVDELLDAAAGGAMHSISDVGGKLAQYLQEYAEHGKLNSAFFNVVGKLTERSGEFAAQWVDHGMRWAQDAIGTFLALGTQALDEEGETFGPVQVFSEAPVEIGEGVAGSVAESVRRHMEEMGQRQDKLAAAEAHPIGKDEHRFEEAVRFEVRTGHLTPKTLVRLKTNTDDSAGFSRMWAENTADLQKLISGVFMVMSQKTSPVGRTVVDDVKKGFERVMLKQEQLASNSSSHIKQEALLPDGLLKLESLQRVKTIADDSLEMTRYWFEKNQDYQRMTAGALAHFSTL